jgi:predicted DCC family thiol-disulfide oxidoreductase YuxK
MKTDETLEVWYDGSCPICRRSRTWSEAQDRDGRLVFRDFRSTDDERLPTSRAHHESTMLVSTPSGAIVEGYSAWRRILAVLPGWSWLARLTGIPPLSWLGPLGYRLVARMRNLVAMPLPPESEHRG